MQEIRKKIILLGPVGVGKTSLIRQFVTRTFSDDYLSSIGVRVDKKSVEIKDVIVHLMIWDLAGEIISTPMLDTYMRGASGVFGVFDLTRLDSYRDVQKSLDRAKMIQPDAKFLLLGNKADLVEREELDSKIEFDFLTSAKTGEAVNEAFYLMTEDILSYA